YLDFQTAPALTTALQQMSNDIEKEFADDPDNLIDTTTPASVIDLSERMVAALKQELLKSRIGYPVVTSPDEADLHLSGTFRNDPGGVALDWQMIDLASDSIVAAGTHTVLFFTGSTDPYVDAVLVDLHNIDVDRFAGRGSGSPTSAPPPVASPGLGQPPASTHDGSNTWAVAIGVERYRDDLPPALHAEADARAFAQFAETTLRVPPRHIKLMLNERASKADIASVLEEWLPRNAVKPGGTVYLFFSGHGAPDPQTGQAYLVPWDADPAYIKTRGYPLKQVYSNLNRLKKQQTITLLDACFSGSGDRSVLAKGTRPLVPVQSAPTSGVISFSASAANQTTGAAPNSAHGLFTHHLLTGLYGQADANRDAIVDLAELSAYVTDRVVRDARLDNREQLPSLQLPSAVKPGAITLVRGLQR
ncbi:MAG: caspase family protein, partial [Myxococcota bacterium]